MKFKKSLAMLLALSCVSFSLVGCSKNNDKVEEQEPKIDLGGKTVTMYAVDNPEEEKNETRKAKLLQQKQSVEEKYNCKIEFVDVNLEYGSLIEQITKMSAAGTPLADIIRVNGWFAPALQGNNLLNDATEAIKELKIASKYIGPAEVKDKAYGFVMSDVRPDDGLIFNQDMIKRAGMDKMPNEMFRDGKWDYENFYNYLTELKSKLNTDEYPFFIQPSLWALLAPHANGGYVMSNEGKLGYLNEGTIESIELLKKITENSLVRQPNVNSKGNFDYPTTVKETFQKQKEVAMTNQAMWQVASDLVGKFNYGFVPYPWGSQVSVNGDYKTLSDGFKSTYTNADVILTLKKDNQVTDVKTLLSIAYDYRGEEISYMREEYEKYESKGLPIEPRFIGSDKWFNDDLSVELFEWQAQRVEYEPYSSFHTMLKLSYGKAVETEIIHNKKPVRATLESVIPNDASKLEAAGYKQD